VLLVSVATHFDDRRFRRKKISTQEVKSPASHTACNNSYNLGHEVGIGEDDMSNLNCSESRASAVYLTLIANAAARRDDHDMLSYVLAAPYAVRTTNASSRG